MPQQLIGAVTGNAGEIAVAMQDWKNHGLLFL